MQNADRTPVKVLIADDHPLILAGVRRVLDRSDDIDVVGEARSGPELLQLVDRRRPHVVLTDLRIPGVSGTECIDAIRTRWPEVKVLVLSACEDRPTIDAALAAGASAYVLKSLTQADIASLIRQAAGGTVFHATSVGRRAGSGGAEAQAPLLTRREQAILRRVAAGSTTAAISRDLWVSEHTVKFHLSNIYRKLGVPNRAGAVRYALEHRIDA